MPDLNELLAKSPDPVRTLLNLAGDAARSGDTHAAAALLQAAHGHKNARLVQQGGACPVAVVPLGEDARAMAEQIATVFLQYPLLPPDNGQGRGGYVVVGRDGLQQLIDWCAGQASDVRAIVDISRLSLNISDDDRNRLHAALGPLGLPLVVRRKSQLKDADGTAYSGPHMVCPNIVALAEPDAATRADLAWWAQVHFASATSLDAVQPSAWIEKLLSAEPNDATLLGHALDILALVPDFTPALAYAQANGYCSNGGMGNHELAWYTNDAFGTRSLLSLGRFAAGTSLDRLVQQAKTHCLPDRSDSRKRIMLSVGRKQRDLFITLFLRHWLEELGHEVFIRPSQNVFLDGMVELLPDAVVWGERTTLFKYKLAQEAKARSITSIVRREEAGHTYSSWEYADPKRRSWTTGQNDYADLVDLEIFFGPQPADIIATHGHMPREHTFCAGAMLFDIYRKGSLAPLLPERANFLQGHGLNPDKKTMLWCARWAHADRDPNTAIPESQKAEGKGEPDKRVVEYIEMCKLGRKRWLDALDRLYAERGDDWNFIYRPHPGELPESYVTHFQEKGMNVPVILDDYIPVLLGYTDLIIHASSTTALEGHYCDIPALNFADPDPGYLLTSGLSPMSQDYETLLSHLDQIQPGTSNADLAVVKQIEESQHGVNDGWACKRAAQRIHEVVSAQDNRPVRLVSDEIRPFREDNSRDYIKGNATMNEIEFFYGLVQRLCTDNAEGK